MAFLHFPGAQEFKGPEQNVKKMVTDQRTTYEKMVAKQVKEDKRTAYTVPYVVRQLTPMEWVKLRDTPSEEAVKRKKKLELKVKDPVPHGRYPCNLKRKGLDWCQVTIMKESAELKYRIFGIHVALSVEVNSLRSDGNVQMWVQGEEYDTTDMTMKF